MQLGHKVAAFKWHHYFSAQSNDYLNIKSLVLRAQNKYVVGPKVSAINQDFVAMALGFHPDLVFVYRGTHISAIALRAIRTAFPSCVLVGYCNDDPFAPNQPKYLWRHFIESVPHYDLMLAYRIANIQDLRNAGAKRVELFRSWYVVDRNFPVELSDSDALRFSTDVVFVGHYEPDQRLSYMEEIVRAGFSLRLFGPKKYWNKPLAQSKILRGLAPVQMVWGDDYNRALCGAKIALCFFSKLNRDTYTRRTFEIPATRTLMVSEYTDDVASLYRAGIEADFFSSRHEMIEKIRFYLADETARRRVAQAGYLRVKTSGHDVESRVKELLSWVRAIQTERGVV